MSTTTFSSSVFGARLSTKRFIFTNIGPVAEARAHLGAYFRFYNEERPHEALGYRTPHEVYFGSSAMLASAVEAVV